MLVGSWAYCYFIALAIWSSWAVVVLFDHSSPCALVPPSPAPGTLVCHRLFLLVTAGAYVLRCRSVRRPHTCCFCANSHFDYLRGFRLQRWVGGLLCFFLHTSFLATSEEATAVKRCSRPHSSECAPHARAGFVQPPCAAMAQTPCRHRFLAFPFFSEVTQKIRRALAQSFALSAFPVQVCSHTACSSELATFDAPLRHSVCACSHEPGAGLRRPLMWCLLPASHRALATADLSALPSSFCVPSGLSAHSLRLHFLFCRSGWFVVLVIHHTCLPR